MSEHNNFMVTAMTFYVLSYHERISLDTKTKNGRKYIILCKLNRLLNGNWMEREIKNEI